MLSNKVDSQPAPPSMSHSRRYWRESLELPADSARSGVWTKGLANVPESFVSCGLEGVVPTKKKKASQREFLRLACEVDGFVHGGGIRERCGSLNCASKEGTSRALLLHIQPPS